MAQQSKESSIQARLPGNLITKSRSQTQFQTLPLFSMQRFSCTIACQLDLLYRQAHLLCEFLARARHHLGARLLYIQPAVPTLFQLRPLLPISSPSIATRFQLKHLPIHNWERSTQLLQLAETVIRLKLQRQRFL
jgi:hypothetical protein